LFTRSDPTIFSKEAFFNPLGKDKGIALFTALVMALIISVITMSIAFTVRQKIVLTHDLTDRSTAWLKAYSGYNEVLYNILTAGFSPTGLKFKQTDGTELFWNLYGEPIEISEGLTVRLRDGAGMLSPVFMPRNLKRLLEYVSKDSKTTNLVSDALADWQDPDTFRRLYGAEDYDYRIAGYSYGPRNFYIQVSQELMLLKEFDSALYEKIKDDLVYWSGRHINYLTMSETVLRALLANDVLVDRILQLRKDENISAGVFRRLSGIPLSEQSIPFPSGWIKIEIKAQVGKTVEKIEAMLVKAELAHRPFMVVEWKR
jgi:type II secretory pathway component PulK